MGDSRGCRGGLRRGLRRCRAAPPLPLVVLPPDGVSTLRYARGPVPPKRRAAALIGFAPFPLPPPPLRRWRRPLGAKACAPAAGFRCAPLCPCCAVSRGSGGGRPLRQAPAIPFFWSGGGWLLRGHSAAVAPFAGLAAGSQGRGGLLQRPLAAAPLRRRAPPLQPRPPVLAPGRGYFVFAAAGLGIAPPAGGAKGLPGCTRCAVWVRCTWLRHESSASRYRLQPRLTIVRRE